jgi:hypothetical protein
MPLPQQVIEQLSQEPSRTPGWSFGILSFSAGILFIVLFVYFGITAGYEPYLNSQIAQLQKQIDTAGKSISADQEQQLLNYYSQTFHLQTLLKNHIVLSPFFSWLENNTEANVYYSGVTFSSGNQMAITVVAKTQADLIQQIAIFESAPAVTHLTVSSISPSVRVGAVWQQASVILFMDPSIFSNNS